MVILKRPENRGGELLVILLCSLLLVSGFPLLVDEVNGVSAEIPTRNIITVGWSGADYTSISDAVAAASDGDEIHIFTGTYPGNLDINKKLTIKGNGTENTVVMTESFENRTFMVSSDDVHIKDIHFKGIGDSYYPLVIFNGSASTKNFVIEDCEFSDTNELAVGWGANGGLLKNLYFHDLRVGVVINEDGGVIVDSCEFERVSDTSIMIQNTREGSIIRDSTFLGNGWNYQRGVYLSFTSNDILENLWICNMSAGIEVGASTYSLNITGSDIRDNEKGISASPSAGPDNGWLFIYGNMITRNNISIELMGQTNVRILYNQIVRNYGFGMNYVSDNQNVSVIYNNFIDNGWSPKQVYDLETVPHKYNSETIGNYWSDHTSPDDDEDGIVDTFYNISAYSKDQYPRTTPFKPYSIPRIATTPLKYFNVGSFYDVQYFVGDEVPWRDDLEWTMTSTPAGLTFTDELKLQGDFTGGGAGSYNITIRVTDGLNPYTQSFTLLVNGTSGRPTITTIDVTTATVGSLYRVNYNAVGSGTIYWCFDSNCTFLSFNSSTRVLSGTPAAIDIGSYWVNITAIGNEGEGFHNFTLTVQLPYIPGDDDDDDDDDDTSDDDLDEDDIRIDDVNELESDRRKRVSYTGSDENVTVSWYIEGRGFMGNGTSIVLDLPPGTYNLTMSVRDSHGNYQNVSTSLVVQSVGNPAHTTNWLPIFLVTIIALVIIILAASFFIYRNRFRTVSPEPEVRVRSARRPVSPRPDLKPSITFGGGGLVKGGSIDDMSVETSYMDEVYPDPEGPDLEEIIQQAVSMPRYTDFVVSKKELVGRARERYREGEIPKDVYLEIRRFLEE